jgi:hypothetical protein
MRRPGFRDAWLALELYGLRRESELRAARDFVGAHLLSASWEELKPLLDYAHPRNPHLRQVVSYWELAASFVVRGVWHPDVYLDACDEGLFTYAVLEEHMPRIREIRPNFFSRTEAVIHEHPRVKGRLMEIRTRIFRSRKEREGPTADA